MEAIIRTENKTLFEMLLYFLERLNISVETKEKVISRKAEPLPEKKFDPKEYEGMLSHLNLDIEAELQNMRNAWKKRNF
jgi:hypothetical protein